MVRIYDLGEADGMKFITMEFVEGEDLRSMLLREKKLAPEKVVEIVQQFCRALEAAHAVGTIHRDLKPQNVMQGKSGRVLFSPLTRVTRLRRDKDRLGPSPCVLAN